MTAQLQCLLKCFSTDKTICTLLGFEPAAHERGASSLPLRYPAVNGFFSKRMVNKQLKS